MPIKFSRPITRFGLLHNNFVICLLEDYAPTVFEQKSLIQLTGSEIVVVHGMATYTEIRQLKRWPYEPKPVDQTVANKKDLFRKGKDKIYNPPIEVQFTPNVVLKTERTMTSTFFVDKDGDPHEIPDELPSSEKAFLANLLKASNVLVELHVLEEYSNQASPYRSVPG